MLLKHFTGTWGNGIPACWLHVFERRQQVGINVLALYVWENSGEEVRVTHFTILIFQDFARRQQVSARNLICKRPLRLRAPYRPI